MQSIILDFVNVYIVVAICYPVIECACIGTDMKKAVHDIELHYYEQHLDIWSEIRVIAEKSKLLLKQVNCIP